VKNILNFIKILTKRYLIDSFFLTFPQLIAIFVTLITLPIILANIPIKDYGIFQFVLALQLWIVTLTAGHIILGAKKGIAKGLDGTFLFAFFYRLKLLAVLGLIGVIISIVLYRVGFTVWSLLLLTMSLFLIIGYLPQVSYREFFIAKKQFKNFAIWQTIPSVLVSIALAAAAFLTHNILICAITYFGLITLISWSGVLYVVYRNNLFFAYKQGRIDRKCIPYGLKLIPASLILQTSNKISNFIIGPFFGFANLAVFSIASQLDVKFKSFTKLSYNLLYSDFAKYEQDKLVKKIKSRLKQGIMVSVIITLGCIFLGYIYINLFLPQLYQSAKLYFLILSLGLPAVILQIILHTVLAANLRYKELTVLLILPNLIKIILIILLGLLFKVIGVCWGVALGAWISFSFYYFLTIRKELAIKLIKNFPLLKKLSNF